MAKSKSVNSLDMFGNMAKLNTKPSRTKKDEGLTSNVVKKTYHVSFYNGEDVFFETELEEGNMIEAPHDKPQKASDAGCLTRSVTFFNRWQFHIIMI